MLSDLFVPMLDDWTSTNDPIEEYLVGLRLLEDVADDVEVVVPVTGRSAWAIRCAPGSTWIARTSWLFATAVSSTTLGSRAPSLAGSG